MSAIRTRALGVRYGDIVALQGVDVEIAEGRMTGLVGVNGSGKSSFLGAVMGTVPATGEVRVLGRTADQARRAGLIAYVPQSERVDWDFPVTVRDVVTMGRYGRMGILRRARAADRAAVDAAMVRLGIDGLHDRAIGELSGGQRKRAFVARSIAQEARVMLLDEPFAGVDRGSAATMRQVLRELVDEGVSVVVSDHDLAEIRARCDEVVLFKNRVLFAGAPTEALSAERIEQAFGGPGIEAT